ncbi:MAG: PD-(D/E)XK nuclease family protein, partial [Actinomycetota bacterium]
MDVTSVQQRLIDDLLAVKEFPTFRSELADELRSELERRLAPVSSSLGEDRQVWITKARLVDLHTRCEGLYLANVLGEEAFEFSTQLALGSLVHRAVEIGVYRSALSESELVGRAVELQRRDDPRFDDFLGLLDEGEAAELEAEAVRRVVLFKSTFPPLPRTWAPVVELPLRVTLAGGSVTVSVRPDLSLGTADPAEPMRARRLLIELKTGMERPEHDEDVRLYALAATLRFGVPPYRVATVNLDSGTWRAQDVSEDLLGGALRRLADGCLRAAELLAGAEPNLRPGAWCGWCPRRPDCPA